jgi:outer membrane immunogenic protein
MRALRLGAAVAAVAAGLSAGTARADGPPPGPAYPPGYLPAYMPTVTYDWTGVYVGGHIGAANARREFTYDGTLDPVTLLPEEFAHSATSFVGGGFVGLQKQWSSIVLGVEAGYLWLDDTQSTGSLNVANTTLSSCVRNLFLATGKFGFANDNMLAYFKGGWASSEIGFRSSVTNTGALLTSSSGRENGWTAGVGVEYALWEHVIFGVEYDYVAFNPGTRPQVPTGLGPPGTNVASGLDIQSVTARLSFKLGISHPAAVESIPAR